MKATYNNRYGDNIVFTEVNNTTVEMTGYNPEWIRYGYPNDYSEAYEMYKLKCKSLVEVDYDYLVDDPNENCTRIMSFPEFVYTMEEKFHDRKENPFKALWKFVVSDMNHIDMVDPSGGPYINVGMNLGRYFDDNTPREVQEIKFASNNNKIILTIKKQSK
jgi:hypothetical protein